MFASALLRRFLPRSAAFIAALLAAAPALHALTNDELLPENLVGKTLSFTHTAASPNSLEPGVNTYRIVFSTASTYVRSSATLTTEGGTYTVLDSSIASTTGGRVTNIQINNNWYAPGNTTAVLLTLTQGASTGVFAATELFNPIKNSGGTFTIAGGSGGGGATTAPVVTSATTATATVGTPFNYQITATPAATSFVNTGGNAPIAINPTTGLVTGTFTTAGTFTFSYTAANAIGTTKSTIVTVTVTGGGGGGTGGTVASYAGTYTGTIYVAANGGAETIFTTYTAVVSASGALVAQDGELTGTVNASGIVTFASNGLGLSTGTLSNQRLNALGTTVASLTTSRVFRLFGTGYSGSGTATAALAPNNLVGYRGKVGAVYQFTVTGSNTGAVWGTDVYTDDSNVATAAVHAGVLSVGETKTVTITILAGQSSYAASTRNNIKASSWGAWSGSYAFAGAGAVATLTGVASAIPTAAPGFLAGTGALSVGGRLVCPVTVIGGGFYTYRWYLNGVLIAGAFSNPYVVESVTAANSGTYSVDVTNSLGTTRITAGTVTINAAGAPTFNLQPFDKVVAPGGVFALATDAAGSGLTYQWFRNGIALSGETGPVFLRQNVNTADAGSYTVRVTNSAGTVTSSASVVTLSPTASTLRNISVRTNAAATQIVIPGITISGTGSKRVIIRAVGPGLSQFGLTGVMADPKLAVYDGSTKIAESDNWDGTPSSIAAFAAVGAFPLAVGSKDAALVTTLPASASGKGYTVQVSSANAQGGIVLIEVYDADTAPTSKLSNVSVRSISAPGADVLIMGLTLQGTGKRTLLIRGIGPTLASFGVAGTLVDPKLTIFDSNSRELLTNNDWSDADFASEMVQAQTFVAAFPLKAGSKDSSTLSLLDAGGYTLQVSGNDNGSGEALVEVYEIP